MDANRLPPINARLCRTSAAVAGASALLFVGACALLWLLPQFTEMVARETAKFGGPITITPVVKTAAVVLNAAHMGVLAWGLFALRRLFLRFADGHVFEPDTGRLLRRFGMSLALFAVLTPFVAAATSVLITMGNAGGGQLSIGVSDHEVTLILVGALLVALGSVMADATRLATELQEIV